MRGIKFFSKKDWSLIKRAFKYLKPHKLKYIFLFFTMLTEIVLGIIHPLIWARILTYLFSKNIHQVLIYICYLSLIFFLQTITGYLKYYLTSLLNQNLTCDLKKEMYFKVLNLPVKAFDKIPVGEFTSRMNNDAQVISNIITNQFLSVVVDVIKVITIAIIMFKISWPLAIIILVSFPVSFLVSMIFGKKIE